MSEAAKTKMLLERDEVAIVVQELLAFRDTVCRENNVWYLPNSESQAAESLIVSCCCYRDLLAEGRDDLEGPKPRFEIFSTLLVASALQNFKQDDVISPSSETARSFATEDVGCD